jgi:hypothetical protein
MRFAKVFAASAASFSVAMVQAGVPLAAQAAAQTGGGVGKAMAVIEASTATGQAGKRVLAVGSNVFIGDLVATDTIGEAQLLFSDGTRMVVGSNSSLVIDEFLFRGQAAENKFAVRALGGAFRFISGDSGDSGYSIRTPSATIGVRGTAFDFTVTPGEGTKLVLLEGEATLCDGDSEKGEEGDCATVATPCAVLSSESGEEVEEVREGKEQVIQEDFPYVTSEETLLAPFQVPGHGCAEGGLATQALESSAIPVEAIIAGGIVIVGGVVIGILAGSDSNNNTND